MIHPQKKFSPQVHTVSLWPGGCLPWREERRLPGRPPPECPLPFAGSVFRGTFQKHVEGFCEEAPGSGGSEGRRAALSVLPIFVLARGICLLRSHCKSEVL